MDLEDKIEKLKNTKESYFEIAEKIMGVNSNIYQTDLYLIGSIKRALAIIGGFTKLLESKNYLAATLVRVHLDTLFQIYILWLISDHDVFITKILKGTKPSDIKNSDGTKLTDGYIAKRFFEDKNNKKYIGLKNVYKETSGFVHFSKKHIFFTMSNAEEGKHLRITLSESNDSISDEQTHSILDCMLIITEAQFKYLYGWVATKEKQNNFDN